MGFNEDLNILAERFIMLKDSITTEEATKMSMIVPLFQFLGYDVFNPTEFCPEFTSDVGIKKGEKVDYAIMEDGNPIVLIECKCCGVDLDRHSSQLFRYFGTSSAKFCILTNGLNYKFYTDLDESNKMDLTPFLDVNLSDLKESSINELKKFSKSTFDKAKIFSTASELKYSNLIKEVLKQELNEPSDEFVRFLLCSIYEGQKNQRIINKFKPIVKKSFNTFINELMNQKISTALKNDNEADKISEIIPEEKVVTTQIELEAFYIIRGILSENIPVDDIVYRDTESYFSILYQDNNRKPICRIDFDKKVKQLLIPDENKNYVRYYLTTLSDIYKYKKELILVSKRFINES